METYTLATLKALTAHGIADWMNGLRGSIQHDGERKLIVENVIQIQTIPHKPGTAYALALVEVKNFI